MSLFELFERFVVAQEKQAEAAMLMASGGSACNCKQNMSDPTISDDTECTAGTPPGKPFRSTPVSRQDDWDPYKSQPMRKYEAGKQAILRRELANLGLEPGEKLTGVQLHELLLEKAKERGIQSMAQAPAGPKQAELPTTEAAEEMQDAAESPAASMFTPAPPAEAPAAAPQMSTPAAPAAPVTLDSVRGLINAMSIKSPDAGKEAIRLLNEVGGVSRLTDAATGQQLLPDEKIAPLCQALTAANARF